MYTTGAVTCTTAPYTVQGRPRRTARFGTGGNRTEITTVRHACCSALRAVVAQRRRDISSLPAAPLARRGLPFSLFRPLHRCALYAHNYSLPVREQRCEQQQTLRRHRRQRTPTRARSAVRTRRASTGVKRPLPVVPSSSSSSPSNNQTQHSASVYVVEKFITDQQNPLLPPPHSPLVCAHT